MSGQLNLYVSHQIGTGPAASSRPGVVVHLLGSFELRVGDRPVSLSAGAQRLVALLALRGRCGRSRLAGELWPDTTEQRAMGSLRTTIWRINQAAPGLVESTPGSAELEASAEVDVRRLIDLSRGLLASDLAAEDLAIATRTGDLLPDWEDEWLTVDRERLRQLQLHVLEAQAERLLRIGAYGLALECALTALRAEPLRESAHRTVIRIHLAEGNRTEARRAYDRCVELFDRELGLLPSDLTAALLAS